MITKTNHLVFVFLSALLFISACSPHNNDDTSPSSSSQSKVLKVIEAQDKGAKTKTENKRFITPDSCCENNESHVGFRNKNKSELRSEITCPHCGNLKMEIMPEDMCIIRYTCEKCGVTLYPKKGDCCVFCSYGSHKCPSKQ